MKQFITALVLTTVISLTYGISEMYELAQQQLEEELKEREHVLLEEAMVKSFKMRNGIGGITLSVHHPSGRKFIHRNKWTFVCLTDINLENGYCPGLIAESLSMFKPKVPKDYCFFKTFTTINETICLSQGTVSMKEENGTVSCTTTNGNHSFPTYITSMDNYLKMCRNVSENVTYVYYADLSNKEHVEFPVDNPHFKCENFDPANETEANSTETTTVLPVTTPMVPLNVSLIEEINKNETWLNIAKWQLSENKTTTEKYDKHTLESMRFKESNRYIFAAIWNRNDTCLWTEQNKLRAYDKVMS